MSALDLDRIVAIDVHTHAEVGADGRPACRRRSWRGRPAYFKAADHRMPTLDELAAHYRERSMAAVVFTVDAEHQLEPPIPNEDVLEAAERHADVLIRSRRRPAPARRRCARPPAGRGGGARLQFHPTLQGFSPADGLAHPVLEVLEELQVPALFHSGQTGIGAGLPGGGGLRLRYSDPMLLDDVAADFPGLTVIIAHPSFPWQDEALSVATHKANVYIDLSGWSPKYFPPQLVRYANTLLKDKVMFGSDFPVILPDRWLRDFAGLDIKDEVRPLILKDNAARVLGLAREA
ncbi:MAG: amidohydrolase family protein [Candidatus Nanopelagicales bacterium]